MIWKIAAGVAMLIGLLFLPLAIPGNPITTTIDIAVPPSMSYRYVTTPANWPKWHPSSLSVTGAVGHSLEVGEVVWEAFSVAGRKGRARWTVQERQAPALWVIDGHGERGGGATISYRLTAVETGTRFTRIMTYRMPNPGLAILDRLSLHDRIKSESEEALRRLKIELEKTPDGTWTHSDGLALPACRESPRSQGRNNLLPACIQILFGRVAIVNCYTELLQCGLRLNGLYAIGLEHRANWCLAQKERIMIHVMAVIRVQPEHLSAAISAMTTLAAQSRLERGCLRYEVFQRTNEPALVTQEQWADAAAEAAHMSGPNVATAFAAVGALLAAAPEIHHYTPVA